MWTPARGPIPRSTRSEEHTSELQSHRDLHSFPTRRSSDLETLKTFGAEDGIVETYEKAMGDYVDASARANSSLNLLNGSQSVILNVGLAAQIGRAHV